MFFKEPKVRYTKAMQKPFAPTSLLSNMYRFLIFFASFLLFSVEPIICKYILPWYGGSPSVWIVALLFFQVVLLAGYTFAHAAARLPRSYQYLSYMIVIGLAIVFLPITPHQPDIHMDPTMSILWLLIACIGLPYFILSSTSPLLQLWSHASHTETRSYRLYAWSNFGSLVGLLAYPVIIEPYISVQVQTQIWSGLFILFGVCVGVCTVFLFRTKNQFSAEPAAESIKTEQTVTRNKKSDITWWVLLSFAPSALLLAITNYITQDIASVPLLWVIPLSIYLISFIITFQNTTFYDRSFFAPMFLYGSLVASLVIMLGANISNILLIVTLLLLLGLFCIVCNGELYQLRPTVSRSTSFYFWISIGGALGGAFVALLAPIIFPLYFEFHFSICFTMLLVFTLWQTRRLWTPKPRLKITSTIAMAMVAIIVITLSAQNVYHTLIHPTYIHRDFFGSLRIEESKDYKGLYHGRTLHGMQFKSEALKCWPTTYYGYTSGLGRAMSALKSEQPVRLGIVGLGTGTAAVYGDYVKYYELNPEVKNIALNKFSYLSECAKKYDIVLGDARLSLEHEEPQNFNLIALDAFSSDAIPIHLLTKEAFDVYLKHLAPHGVIAVHISNRYLDFKPVIGGIAEKFNLHAAIVNDSGEPKKGVTPSGWALLSDDESFFTRLSQNKTMEPDAMTFNRRILWTDTKSNILSIFRLY